jgi:PKD repeat protein
MTQPPFSDPAGQPAPWPGMPASQPYPGSPYAPMPGSQPYPGMTPAQGQPPMPGSQPYPGFTTPASQPYPSAPPVPGYPSAPPNWPPSAGQPVLPPAPPPPPATPATRGERSLRTAILGAASLIVLLVIYFTLPGAAAGGVRSAYPTVHAAITILSGARDSQTVTENTPVQFSGAQSTGNDLTYAWDFGDGTTANGQVVTHTFANSSQGDTVTLTVSDPLGDSSQTGHQDSTSLMLRVYPAAPIALFTATPGAFDGTGIPYTFDASGSSGENISDYQWDFGDGTPTVDGTSSESHEYTSLGTFTVTLKVTDDVGQVSQPYSIQINVTASAPQAIFAAPTVDAFGDVSVDGSPSTGDITDYTWNWGDGSSPYDGGSSPTASYAYSNIGTYTITLTVTDAFGRTSSVSHSVDYTGM